jgi:hypothetical protein
MEAIWFSKKSVDTQRNTRSYIREDSTLHNHLCENLKSHTETYENQNFLLIIYNL